MLMTFFCRTFQMILRKENLYKKKNWEKKVQFELNSPSQSTGYRESLVTVSES